MVDRHGDALPLVFPMLGIAMVVVLLHVVVVICARRTIRRREARAMMKRSVSRLRVFAKGDIKEEPPAIALCQMQEGGRERPPWMNPEVTGMG